ncbi:uncharacterized protein METZ01_LOCUS209935 [marine metagenome]|uniref:Uncharacterized protein n=1 Tax=marine metagenome TaxID=408172 RepID=A0A382F4N4_9ZZZZ
MPTTINETHPIATNADNHQNSALVNFSVKSEKLSKAGLMASEKLIMARSFLNHTTLKLLRSHSGIPGRRRSPNQRHQHNDGQEDMHDKC